MDHWNNFVDSETLCNLDNANAKHWNVSWNLNITLLKICTMREDGRDGTVHRTSFRPHVWCAVHDLSCITDYESSWWIISTESHSWGSHLRISAQLIETYLEKFDYFLKKVSSPCPCSESTGTAVSSINCWRAQGMAHCGSLVTHHRLRPVIFNPMKLQCTKEKQKCTDVRSV